MSIDTAVLKGIPLFATMDDDELSALAEIVGRDEFTAGHVIFREGDSGDTLFIVESGEVNVSILNEERERIVLDTMEAGDYFGEFSLFDGGPRSATATATHATRVFTLKHQRLQELLLERPSMAQDVIQGMVKRFRHTGETLRHWTTRNANEVIEEKETFGNRIADVVARFGGSWTFIGIFAAILLFWTVLNSEILRAHAFDPYPYILLNLFLSMLAAVQAPVIMMSQNRQDTKDRIRSELDYQVNLKAELEITELLQKVDSLQEAVERITP